MTSWGRPVTFDLWRHRPPSPPPHFWVFLGPNFGIPLLYFLVFCYFRVRPNFAPFR